MLGMSLMGQFICEGAMPELRITRMDGAMEGWYYVSEVRHRPDPRLARTNFMVPRSAWTRSLGVRKALALTARELEAGA